MRNPVFPIKGKAIHTDQTGSKGAIEIYKKILESYPNDYQSRWLINIAYMTLNEYPDGVPSQYLITPKQLEDDVQFPAFTLSYTEFISHTPDVLII